MAGRKVHHVHRNLVRSVILVASFGGLCGLISCTRSSSSRDDTVTPTKIVKRDTTTAALEGLFDVGGHKLYLRCEGSGSPTIVYLHGIIVTHGGSQNSGLIPGYLRDRAQICVYDRSNVGFSDGVPGPLTGKDAVNDLHRLLEVARIPSPVVLLGSSFGGLIATMYASTYPGDVSGMVLLDPSLASELVKIDERFLPINERLQPDNWKHNIEQMDQLATYRQANAMPVRRTDIVLTFLATTRLGLNPAWPVDQMTAAIRAEQRAFVDRFPSGRLLILDNVPHFMERAIPGTVAEEVHRVAAAAKKVKGRQHE